MNCPRCESEGLKPVSPYVQNRKFRCDECGLTFSVDHYEFEYELFHKDVCGRCKQPLETKAVKSTPTKNYVEVIEVNFPIKFYWTEDGFDGVSFSYPARELFEWEQEMLDKCMKVMKTEGEEEA